VTIFFMLLQNSFGYGRVIIVIEVMFVYGRLFLSNTWASCNFSFGFSLMV